MVYPVVVQTVVVQPVVMQPVVVYPVVVQPVMVYLDVVESVMAQPVMVTACYSGSLLWCVPWGAACCGVKCLCSLRSRSQSTFLSGWSQSREPF